jgi:Acetyltransferase (GNAT) family
MTHPAASTTLTMVPIVTKETLIKGQPATIRCVDLLGHTFDVQGGAITTVGLEDEWFEDLDDPQAVVLALKEQVGWTPDLFTFWQRMPDVQPRHAYHIEWAELAALPIQSYEHWWKYQIKSRVRNQIRKAEKDGVVVKEVPYDDHFVRGMTAIFNESPVRQGRPFWHYGKSFETVKAQFARHIDRERMIGAYLDNELIGFIMLANAGRFGITGQIISSLKHRDKSPNNALIAKAVELCAAQGLSHLIYLFWSDDSLSEFKRRCGFEPVHVPRYWVPLTWRGRVALATGLHRGWKSLIPSGLKVTLKDWRRRWYERTAN